VGGSTPLQNYERLWFDLLNLLDHSEGIETPEGDTALNVAAIRRGKKRQAESGGDAFVGLCNVDLTHFRNHVSVSQT